MPKPSPEHMHHHIEKPSNDNDYFERMSRVIFMSGLNWQVLDKKWPKIKEAFANFDINQVAYFDVPEIDQLMANPDVIRNLPKIKAVIANAQEMQHVIKESGSMENYLAELKKFGGEDALRKSVSKRFAFMGPGTTVLFLFSVGQDLPKATSEWHARHSKK